MKLKPYPEYKDSGVPWLEKIPKHWEVKRLKRVAQLNPSKSEAAPILTSNADVTFLPMERVGTDGRVNAKEIQPASALWNGFTYFRRADVLVAKITPCFENGKGACLEGLPTEVGFGSTEFIVLRATTTVLPQFLYRTTTLSEFRSIGADAMTGAAGQQRVPPTFVGNFQAALPPLPEQSAIVRFLDYFDHRINRLIRAKRRLIELLNEQKQAIIHRAVTRGLDPSVRLKPSGVEWLGEVPEHWEVRRLKTLISRVTSGSRGWSNFAADDGPLFIRIGNLTRASIGLDFTDAVRLNLPKAAVAEAERTRVRAGDLLLSITAYIGSVAVVPESIGEAYISQHVACCRPIPGTANIKWLAYVLLSPIGQTYGKLCMYGGTKQGLSLDDVKNYVVLLPPSAEQIALVSWIENATKSIDEAMHSAHREISLLREYRTRLIADVVTGKLDVLGVIEAGNGPSSSSGPYPGLPDEAEELDDLDTGEDAGAEEIIGPEVVTDE